MKELEVKIINIDKNKTIEKLKEIGAEFVAERELKFELFDFPDKRLAAKNSFVRLRKDRGICTLTLKEAILNDKAKEMVEIEQDVDFDKMKLILKYLGLRPFLVSKKNRTSYKLGDALIEIDELGVIPTYLEIEAPSYELILDAATKMGISEKDFKNWSTKEILESYGVKL